MLTSVDLSNKGTFNASEILPQNLDDLIAFRNHFEGLNGHGVSEFLLQLAECLLESLNCIRDVA